MTVTHELASLGAGGGPTGAVDNVVEPKLEEAQHVLAGHALPARGLGEDVAELPLGEAVAEASLLLFLQLQEILGDRAAPTRTAMLARRVRALVEGDGLALRAPDVGSQAPREARARSGVARHGQALRRLLRRHPLCGIGVQSLMPVTSMPAC